MSHRACKLLTLFLAALGCLVMVIVGAAGDDKPFAIMFFIVMLLFLYAWSIEYHTDDHDV